MLARSEARTARLAVVVHDDLTQLQLLSGLVRESGLEPLEFRSAEAALEALTRLLSKPGAKPRETPVAVITDLNLPGLDGWRLCRLLHSPEYQSLNGIPILAVSVSLSGKEADSLAADLGAHACLPLPVDGARFIRHLRAVADGAAPRHRLHCLLIEHYDLRCGSLDAVFEKHGYRVEAAGGVPEAEAAWRQTRFDVVVLDQRVALGAVDRILESWHRENPDCVVVILTASPDPETTRRWLRRGAAAVVAEPDDPETLVEICERAHREASLLRVQRQLERRTRELQSSERDLAAMISASPESAFLIDTDGTILRCNPVSARRLGREPEELTGRCIFDFLPPEVAAARRKHVARAVAQGEPLSFEDTREGRSFAHYLYPVRNAGGAVDRVAIFGHDITPFRKTEETLNRQNLLLKAVRRAQELFISGHDPAEVYREMLHILVESTDSAYGFLDEVLHDPDGTPYKLSLALSDISWDENSRRLYQALVSRQSEFRNLENLAGIPVIEARTIIANDVPHHPRFHGLPDGHPTLHSYMGIPLYFGTELIGVAGIANRPGGYSEEVAEFIRPLTQACASIIWAGRAQRRDLEQLKALADSEERYRRLAETSNEGIWVFDGTQQTTYANRRMAEMLGYTAEEMVGLSFELFIFPEDLADHYERIRQRQLGHSDAYERKLRRRDGTPLWTIVSATPILDGEGQFSGSFGMVTDVSDRKRIEEALRHSHELLSYIIEHNRSAVAVHDRDLRYIYVSQRYLQDFGISGQDVIGRYHYDLFPDLPEKWKEVHRRALAGEVISQEDDPWERDDGTVVWSRWEVRPWHEADGSIGGIIVYTEEITERKRAEEERERLLAQLAQAQRIESVGRLAGGVAHDFNNMLAVILGRTEIAMSDLDPADALYSELTEIRAAAERSAALTRQLLAFARKQTIAPVRLDLNETVEGMLKMLRRLLGENIDLAWMPGRNLWPVLMDPSQVDQVLANLCVNARDAIEGFGKIEIETSNATLEDDSYSQTLGLPPGDYIRLTVADTGCGMDQETLSRLFEPFFTTKEIGRGTGLGLATVYGIVQQNRGAIDVFSEPGSGTTFRIYLPRQPLAPSSEAASRDVGVKSPGQATILLVEDEPSMLRMVTRMLEQQGYRVLSSGSPAEAVRLAEGHPGRIDLLMTDVVMPDMNGRELAARLATLQPRIKRLFMSGYTADVIARQGFLEPDVQFLQKPFTLKELTGALRAALV